MDEYEPMEEGLDKVVDTRSVSVIEIKLSKDLSLPQMVKMSWSVLV